MVHLTCSWLSGHPKCSLKIRSPLNIESVVGKRIITCAVVDFVTVLLRIAEDLMSTQLMPPEGQGFTEHR